MSTNFRPYPPITCQCGRGLCFVLQSRTLKNPQRWFYRCPIQGKYDCGFFAWCDMYCAQETYIENGEFGSSSQDNHKIPVEGRSATVGSSGHACMACNEVLMLKKELELSKKEIEVMKKEVALSKILDEMKKLKLS